MNITDKTAYYLVLLGLLFEFSGIIALYICGQKWLEKIEMTKPIGKIYADRENLSELDTVLNEAVESSRVPIDKNDAIDIILTRINDSDNRNRRLSKQSNIWFMLVLLESLLQIISTLHFLNNAK